MSGKTSKAVLPLTVGQRLHRHLQRAADEPPSARAVEFGSEREHGPTVPCAHLQAGCEGSFCLLGLTAWKLDVIKKIDLVGEA